MLKQILFASVTILIFFTTSIFALVTPDYSDLPPGPYCENLPFKQCCIGRQDDCSFPILGTRCYCDDFCANRTGSQNIDCCPDFFSHCSEEGTKIKHDIGEKPEPVEIIPVTQEPKIGGEISRFHYLPPGRYCARLPFMNCCDRRKNNCGIPVDGTMCFCDEFCSNRTSPEGNECCPDYQSHCEETGIKKREEKIYDEIKKNEPIVQNVQIHFPIDLTTNKPIIQAPSDDRNVKRFDDFPPGKYCSQFEFKNCCEGRKDDCKVPFDGTMCYCDEFCSNRTDPNASDCCPDYQSHCEIDTLETEIFEEPDLAPLTLIFDRSPKLQSPKQCFFEGKYYKHGEYFKNNCNTCFCSNESDENLCETNRCLIEPDLLQKLNSQEENLHWHAEYQTEFWGRTLREGIQFRLGTLNPSTTVYKMNPILKKYDRRTLPKQFDARSKWPGFITEIKDQGWCGASWAISTASIASDRFALMSNGKEKIDLSAQHLISCNNQGQQGCDGGYLDRAWIFMRKNGLVDEKRYPWFGKNDKCKLEAKKNLRSAGYRSSIHSEQTDEFHRMGPVYRVKGEEDIMHEIITSGPVQATMKVNQDFFTYKNGIYKNSKLDKNFISGYHSIKILGWGEERIPSYKSPKKFWIVANSWGTGWGENGYFRIEKGTNECEIESYILGALATIGEI